MWGLTMTSFSLSVLHKMATTRSAREGVGSYERSQGQINRRGVRMSGGV